MKPVFASVPRDQILKQLVIPTVDPSVSPHVSTSSSKGSLQNTRKDSPFHFHQVPVDFY